MKTIYCDASFDWTNTEKNGENFVRGKIAVSCDSFERIDKVAVGKVEGLKQYINILELTAIARAIELASELNPKPESLAIYTDSRTAMIWAGAGKINPKVATLAHHNALDYLRKARMLYGGIITFNFTRREGNPAGILLERELEKEKPHAI